MKKLLSFLSAFVILFSVSALSYVDVATDSPYHEATAYLFEEKIILGYEDGSFRGENNITRAEAATILVRAGKFDEAETDIAYQDVDDSHWAYKNIKTATAKGILNGMGGGFFAPGNNVTHNQIIKMLICFMGQEQRATELGGWPTGYVTVAYDEGILTHSEYLKFLHENLGQTSARRYDVALYLYKSLTIPSKDKLMVGDKEYYLGMDSSLLPKADETFPSTNGFTWHAIGTKTYENFVLAGVDNKKVVSLLSSGSGFDYNGYKMGSVKTGGNYELEINLYTDKNDNDIVHSVLLLENDYKTLKNSSDKAFAGESKAIFHLTNAFRKYHDKKILTWCSKAEKSARLYAVEMFKTNHFEHISRDGVTPPERVSAQGIKWSMCVENLYAGDYFGFYAFDGWVTSSDHREGMLMDTEYLGVGGAYDSTSPYIGAFVQNFYTK